MLNQNYQKRLTALKLSSRQRFDQNVSREENLERLSQKFFQSVNTVELCDRENAVDSTSENEEASASVEGDASQDPSSQKSSAEDGATASNSLMGTNLIAEPTSLAPSATMNMIGATLMPEKTKTDESQAIQIQDNQDQPIPPKLTNGKIPDDISEVDNDTIFEAQIRAAAMAEADLTIQKNLWE